MRVKKRLTAKNVASFPVPTEGRLEVLDDDPSTPTGFLLRITAKGVRSYFLERRVRGTRRTVYATLGHVGELSLADARDKARTIGEKAREGVHVVEEKRAARRAAEQAPTVGALLSWYNELKAAKLRASTLVGNREKLDLLSRVKVHGQRFAEIRAADLTPDDVTTAYKGASKAPAYQNRILSFVKAAVRLGISLAKVPPSVSPILLMEKPNPERPRERFLSDAEVPAFWRACDASPWSTGPLYAAFLRFVLLTGQRHEETLRALWAKVDLDGALWIIPAEDRKGVGRKTIRRYDHDVPLSPQAVEILRHVQTKTGDHARVFEGLTQNQRGNRIAPVRAAAGLPRWNIHDLRRTCQTGIAELGFSDEVAHLVTGHRRPGLHGTYNRSETLGERRAALEAWGAHVAALVEADKVAEGLKS